MLWLSFCSAQNDKQINLVADECFGGIVKPADGQ